MLDEIDFTEGMNYDNGFVDSGFITDTGEEGEGKGGREGGREGGHVNWRGNSHLHLDLRLRETGFICGP